MLTGPPPVDVTEGEVAVETVVEEDVLGEEEVVAAEDCVVEEVKDVVEEVTVAKVPEGLPPAALKPEAKM